MTKESPLLQNQFLLTAIYEYFVSICYLYFLLIQVFHTEKETKSIRYSFSIFILKKLCSKLTFGLRTDSNRSNSLIIIVHILEIIFEVQFIQASFSSEHILSEIL